MTIPSIITMSPAPKITFTGYAWHKIQALCAMATGEVSFYGETALEDKTLVMDVWVPKQEAGSCSYETDGLDEAKYLGDMACRDVDPLPPENTMKIWCHTHPGNSAGPSGTDWDTFKERFEKCEWGVMFILAKGGDVSCHSSVILNGQQYAISTDISVDWTQGYNTASFQKTLDEKVTAITYTAPVYAHNYSARSRPQGITHGKKGFGGYYDDGYTDWEGDTDWEPVTPWAKGYEDAEADVAEGVVCDVDSLAQASHAGYMREEAAQDYARGYLAKLRSKLDLVDFIESFGPHVQSSTKIHAAISVLFVTTGPRSALPEVEEYDDDTDMLDALTDGELEMHNGTDL